MGKYREKRKGEERVRWKRKESRRRRWYNVMAMKVNRQLHAGVLFATAMYTQSGLAEQRSGSHAERKLRGT